MGRPIDGGTLLLSSEVHQDLVFLRSWLGERPAERRCIPCITERGATVRQGSPSPRPPDHWTFRSLRTLEVVSEVLGKDLSAVVAPVGL